MKNDNENLLIERENLLIERENLLIERESNEEMINMSKTFS
jgi:hypothetical protein